MAHGDHHPEYVDGCFGCKVRSVAHDARHMSKSVTDENNAVVTEHRDGRQDVRVRPKTYRLGLTQKEA